MKTLLLALLTFSAHAAPIPPAPNCGGFCSEPMRQVVEEFQAARTIDTENLPAVFSGECFHLNRQYNPNHPHHGFTLLDTKDGRFYMGGIFSFFAKENPYRELSVEEAREKTPRRFDDNHRLVLTEEFAYADMNPDDPTTPWKYWLKQSGKNLLLIAQWSIHQQVYCRFSQNP